MRFYYFSIALLVGQLVYSQNNNEFIYFNKTFKPDTMTIYTSSAISVDGGYLSVGTFTTYNTLQRGFYARKINLLGETEWLKSYEQSEFIRYVLGSEILIPTSDNNFLMIGSHAHKNNTLTDIVRSNRQKLGYFLDDWFKRTFFRLYF